MSFREIRKLPPIRHDDRGLTHLDWLLARYHFRMGKSDDDKRCVTLCDIFVTAKFWIKSYLQNDSIKRHEGYPSVLGLFERAKYELSFAFGCREPEVELRITEIFGRDLAPEGERTIAHRDAAYHDKLQLQLYRLRFHGGRAYQLCQSARDRGRFAPVNSRDFYEVATVLNAEDGELAERFEDWGPFVMTLEREFYMGKHRANNRTGGSIFHSVYARGGMISMAGAMLIQNGQILGIRSDSEHYKLLENNMAMVITKLGMYSVPLMPIRVYSGEGEDVGSALDFVRSRLTWNKFMEASEGFQRGRRRATIS